MTNKEFIIKCWDKGFIVSILAVITFCFLTWCVVYYNINIQELYVTNGYTQGIVEGSSKWIKVK